MKRAHLAAFVFGLATFLAVCEVARAQDATGENGEVVEKPPEPPGTVKTLLAYGLAIAGLGMVLVPLSSAFKGNLKYLHARVMMINLLRSNPNHAETMCKTMPGTFMEAIGAAIKTAAMMGGTRDPKVIASATVPTYDATATGVSMKWKTMIGKAKLGLMAAGGGMAIALASGVWPAFVILIGLAAGGGFVYLLVRKSEIDSSILQARAEVLPEVDRAFIDGRYVLPPPAR
jgi:hypothetical protein